MVSKAYLERKRHDTLQELNIVKAMYYDGLMTDGIQNRLNELEQRLDEIKRKEEENNEK